MCGVFGVRNLKCIYQWWWDLPGGTSSKELAWQCRSVGLDPWVGEEGMASHSSPLAWRVSWTEGPGGSSPRVTESQTRPGSWAHTQWWCQERVLLWQSPQHPCSFREQSASGALKTGMPSAPVILLLDWNEGNESTISKRYLYPHFHFSTIYKGQVTETIQVFDDG